ncbi:MAG: PhoU domain-containing protein [Planctomycetota bacterium]|jgi:phosphate uptake regulator
MFHWLQDADRGLALIFRQFGQMLEDGRHVFDAACNAFVGGTDPNVVKDDLFATDRRINHVEQTIRRELVVHLSVSPKVDFPQCLVLMSLVKDAERIGDYAKNIFDLAVECPDFPGDPMAEDIVATKDKVSRMMAKTRALYDSQDAEQAHAFLTGGDDILDHCDAQVTRMLKDSSLSGRPVAAALMYRYTKRVMAHSMNVVTSIVMPVDKLDYFDEDKGTRGKR